MTTSHPKLYRLNPLMYKFAKRHDSLSCVSDGCGVKFLRDDCVVSRLFSGDGLKRKRYLYDPLCAIERCIVSAKSVVKGFGNNPSEWMENIDARIPDFNERINTAIYDEHLVYKDGIIKSL